MKSLFLSATLVLASFSAQAAGGSAQCNLIDLQKESMAYLSLKKSQSGTLLYGRCLLAAAQVSANSRGQQSPDEVDFEAVALKVLKEKQQQDETAEVKKEIFEGSILMQEAAGVEFPDFLNEEADKKRNNPLE